MRWSTFLNKETYPEAIIQLERTNSESELHHITLIGRDIYFYKDGTKKELSYIHCMIGCFVEDLP